MSIKKVVFTGPANTGKSTVLGHLIGKELVGPTLGVEVYPYKSYNIWDCGGTYKGLGKIYYKDADIAFVFGDNDAVVMELKEMSPAVQIHHFWSQEQIKGILH
jgi:GTPase SAR1 family protein